MFPNLNTNRNSIFFTSEGQNDTARIPPPPPPPGNLMLRNANHVNQPTGQHLYQNQSLAEQTISSYTDPGNKNPYNLPCRPGKDGKLYPYNPQEPTYLSKFEVGFNGCFKCGGRDHRDRAHCPLANCTDPKVLNQFFKELEIHKPGFRARRTARRNNDSNNQYYGRQPQLFHSGVSSHHLMSRSITVPMSCIRIARITSREVAVSTTHICIVYKTKTLLYNVVLPIMYALKLSCHCLHSCHVGHISTLSFCLNHSFYITLQTHFHHMIFVTTIYLFLL